MNVEVAPFAQDVEPYPFDDSLPGTEFAAMDVSDRDQDHITIENLIEAETEVDGVLFRLLGWPKGQVRRAKLVRCGFGRLMVLAYWRGERRMWLPTSCVVVNLEELNEAR